MRQCQTVNRKFFQPTLKFRWRTSGDYALTAGSGQPKRQKTGIFKDLKCPKVLDCDLAMPSIQPVIIINHVQEDRSGINQAIDSIQHAAMTGNGCAHVFDAYVPFDHADREIAKLAAHADDQTSEDQLLWPEMRKREMQ